MGQDDADEPAGPPTWAPPGTMPVAPPLAPASDLHADPWPAVPVAPPVTVEEPPRRWPWVVGGLVLGAVALTVGAVVLANALDEDEGGEISAENGGSVFEDPDGEYSIETSPDWESAPDPITGVESFLVTEPEGGFAPNVTVVASHDASGASEQEYIDFSEDHMGPLEDAEVVHSGTFEGTDGDTRGFLEYQGRFGESPPLHFLAVVDIVDGTAIIATFTSTDDRFDELRADVEPFLRTVRGS